MMKSDIDNALNTITVSRLIRASPERVFEAWTKADLYCKWFGPEDCSVGEIELDVRVGGKFRVAVESKMGKLEACGRYTEVTPFSRLAFTWDWRGNPDLEVGETLVVIDLKAHEEGTAVTLTHSGFRDAGLAAEHTAGWAGSLEKLERLVGRVSTEKPLGLFSWNELMTDDPEAAKRFYSEIFGWTFESMEMPDSRYEMASASGQMSAGIMEIPSDAPEGMRPNWGGYVTVEDPDGIAEKIAGLGGRILVEPRDIPGVGRFFSFQDPQGAVLSAIRYEKREPC